MINIKSGGIGVKCYIPNAMEKVVPNTSFKRSDVIACVFAGAGYVGTYIPRKLVCVTFKKPSRLNSWKALNV